MFSFPFQPLQTLTLILIWGAVRACCRIFPPFVTFSAGYLQVDSNESPGCAHLIPSGRGEKHHSALGILCLKMVICQLEQILGEQGRWRVDRFHLLYLLNLITGTGLQRGKNILLRVIWKGSGEYGGDPSKTASQSFSQSDVRHHCVHNHLRLCDATLKTLKLKTLYLKA